MSTKRWTIWGLAVFAAGALLILDTAHVFPAWLLVGPVVLGVAGVALLLDQALCSPARKGGFFGSLMMIALSAGTVTQDALLVVDEWSIWPFVAGAIVLGIPLERYAAHRRSATAGPSSFNSSRPSARAS